MEEPALTRAQALTPAAALQGTMAPIANTRLMTVEANVSTEELVL